jgi:hypothetical protein
MLAYLATSCFSLNDNFLPRPPGSFSNFGGYYNLVARKCQGFVQLELD